MPKTPSSSRCKFIGQAATLGMALAVSPIHPSFVFGTTKLIDPDDIKSLSLRLKGQLYYITDCPGIHKRTLRRVPNRLTSRSRNPYVIGGRDISLCLFREDADSLQPAFFLLGRHPKHQEVLAVENLLQSL